MRSLLIALPMRLILIAIAVLFAACSSEPGAGNHPPVRGGSTGMHDLPDYSGLIAHYADQGEGGNGGEEERVASTQQAVLPTNCDRPPHLFKTLSNIVITQATPPNSPGCPHIWSQLNDVTQWWIGYTDAAHAPVSPWGTCQWGSTTWPYEGDRCKLHQDFSCPNGVWYTATLRATGVAAFPWGKTQADLMATYFDGTCRRLATATF